jgi:MFS family permease
MIGAQAIVGDIVAPRERGRYMGLVGALMGLASVTGPVAGGLIVDHLSWRWIFYVNVPVSAASLAIVTRRLRLPRPGQRPRIDYPGAVLLGGVITCMVLIAARGGSSYAWSSLVITSVGAAVVVLTIAWAVVERRAAEPIVPPRLFTDRAFVLACLISLILGIAMFSAISYLPTYPSDSHRRDRHQLRFCSCCR